MLYHLFKEKPVFFSGAFRPNQEYSLPKVSEMQLWKNPTVDSFRVALKLIADELASCISAKDSMAAGKFLDLGSVYASQVLRHYPELFQTTLDDIKLMRFVKKTMLFRALFVQGHKHPLLAEILSQEEIRDYVFNKELQNTQTPEAMEINMQHHVDCLWVAYFVIGDMQYISKMIYFMAENFAEYSIAAQIHSGEITLEKALDVTCEETAKSILINYHIIHTMRANLDESLKQLLVKFGSENPEPNLQTIIQALI